MPRPTCSIVMASYNRAHLLRESIKGYNRSRFPLKNLEIIVIDDHSCDNGSTRDVLRNLHPDISWTYLTTGPKTSEWRDCGAVINAGIRVAQGDHIILTHPEVIPGRDSILDCCTQLLESSTLGAHVYACCRIYYLSQEDQKYIDIVSEKKDTLAIRGIQGFYDNDLNGAEDYKHRTTDNIGKFGFRIQTWESWVFGGCNRYTWKWLGGMLETQKWGSVDVGFMHRRKMLGVTNITCNKDETICIHQNHDSPLDVKTPRVEEDWKKELNEMDLGTPDRLVHPVIDNLGW